MTVAMDVDTPTPRVQIRRKKHKETSDIPHKKLRQTVSGNFIFGTPILMYVKVSMSAHRKRALKKKRQRGEIIGSSKKRQQLNEVGL